MAVHPNVETYAVSYDELARNVNTFRYGIALLLGQLHARSRNQIPREVINAYYYPDVELVV